VTVQRLIRGTQPNVVQGIFPKTHLLPRISSETIRNNLVGASVKMPIHCYYEEHTCNNVAAAESTALNFECSFLYPATCVL
jgi:hypothetical protein